MPFKIMFCFWTHLIYTQHFSRFLNPSWCQIETTGVKGGDGRYLFLSKPREEPLRELLMKLRDAQSSPSTSLETGDCLVSALSQTSRVLYIPGQGKGAAERMPRWGKEHHSSSHCSLQEERLLVGPLWKRSNSCKTCLQELGAEAPQEPSPMREPETGVASVYRASEIFQG